MTYRQKYEQLTNWRKRIYIMNLYHKQMKMVHRGKWTLRKTAEYFNVSIGLVSENLKLFKYYSELRKFVTREAALKFYR